MDTSYIINSLVKMAYTTSDKGAYYIHSQTKDSGYADDALREYVYLKSFLACIACYRGARGNKKLIVELMEGVSSGLSNTFVKMPKSLNYGCNTEEMMERQQVYMDLDLNTEDGLDMIGVQFNSFLFRHGLYLHGDDVNTIVAQNILDMSKEVEKGMKMTPRSGNSKGSSGGGGGGCYIATAIYGSYDCPEVWTLRRFRDETLAKYIAGRLFIHTYYAVSPTVVKLFGDSKLFKKVFTPILNKLVDNLNSKGVANTVYEDKRW